MGSVKGDSRWPADTLKEAWVQMFDYSLYQDHYENLDVQCILMLLEGGVSHVKKVLTAYSALMASEKELLAQLETKTHECWSLKKELERPCGKCHSMEASLLDARKRAKDAQARMDSIANILRLGGSMDPSQTRGRNAAMDLVSQMILGSSPPPKRKKTSREQDSLGKCEVLAPDTFDVLTEGAEKGNGMVPSTMQESPKDLPRKPSPSPSTSSNNITIMGKIKVARSPVLDLNFIPCRPRGTPMSKSFDVPTSVKTVDAIASVKKNLSADLGGGSKQKAETEVSPEKPIAFDLKAGPPPLDDTLRDYVKDSTGKLLANIWFDEDDDDEFELSKTKVQPKSSTPNKEKVPRVPSSPSPKEESPAVIPETPRVKKKKADFWLLKEKRGPSEVSKSSGRKMRQTKLELGIKRKESKVDLSTIASSSTSVQKDIPTVVAVDDEEIIALSPDAAQNRVNLDKYLAVSQESDINTTEFKPLASSTQKQTLAVTSDRQTRVEEVQEQPKTTKPPISDFDRLPTKPAPKEAGFVYARDAVKKKSERQKLEGWDCKECAEYYATMGKNLNPAELKERMNACSRHRDKFKPKLNDTPPGFWNPLFPSTEEVEGYQLNREKRN